MGVLFPMVFSGIRDIFIVFHYLQLFVSLGAVLTCGDLPQGIWRIYLVCLFGGDWVLYYAIASELHASVFSRE